MDDEKLKKLKKLPQKKEKSKIRQFFFFYLPLSVVAFFMIIPFLWMLSTSLKEMSDVAPADPSVYSLKWIPDYHYIIEEGKKVEVNVIGEEIEVRILEGRHKGQIEKVSKRELFTRWKSWWSPWKKEQVIKKDDRIYKVKVIKGTAKIEIIKESGGQYQRIEKTIPIEKVHRGIKPIWSNYTEVIENIPFARFYFNSLFVAICVTLGQVVTSAMAAYAFSRLNFPGRDKLFIGYLATMMIPYAVILVPVYILMNWLNWVDTYKALIIPAIFSAYGTFMLRQFFMGIPVDLEDAAKIDGCNYFRIFWHIILPLSKPALATLTVFTFMGSWVNFMWPLIVTDSVEMKTLPVGLAYFQETGFGPQYNLLMAGAMMATLPIIIVFVFTQRFFVEGIKMTGLKG